jgi:phosphoribosylformylglycinamidine synthase
MPLGRVLRLPIAHADGRYQCDASTLAELREHDQIAFRYCDAEGRVGATPSVNGSLDEIAGVYNRRKNVLGLMPHPERASEQLLGSTDGFALFRALRAQLGGGAE